MEINEMKGGGDTQFKSNAVVPVPLLHDRSRKEMPPASCVRPDSACFGKSEDG